MGDINVFTGPMKCGKTQKILNEIDRQLIAGKSIKVFKPSILIIDLEIIPFKHVLVKK